MAYRLNLSAPLDAEIRRIAREQVEKAIATLTQDDGDRHEAIHDARKRFKKLRGLLILAEAGDPARVRAEIHRYRDAGRALSGARDRTALIEALDGLKARFAGEVETPSFDVVRTALELKRDAAIEALGDPEMLVGETVDRLRGGLTALGGLVLKGGAKRQRAILAEALAKNHRRARRDLAKALRSGAAEDFHDLRKRLKYLAMHLKLASRAWPEALAPLEASADEVAEALGRDHDYAVLRAEIAVDPVSFGARADLDVVLALLDRHQSELRDLAAFLAGRLLCDRPEVFAARLEAWMRLAAGHAPETAPPEAPEALRRHARHEETP